MAGELVAGLAMFKPMLDIARGLKAMSDANIRNAVAIELQEKILAAQAAQATIIERVSELEAEIARMKTWESEKQRYKLADIGMGSFAYVVKPGAENGEPTHSICAACYQRDHKAILQPDPKELHTNLRCPECKTVFTIKPWEPVI